MKLLRYGPEGQEKPGRELGRDEDGRRCPIAPRRLFIGAKRDGWLSDIHVAHIATKMGRTRYL